MNLEVALCKKARMPPPPKPKARHRFDGRFFNTMTIMEVMAVYHGIGQQVCGHTWYYRTLIAVYRDIYNTNPYRKGYGKDWLEHIKRDLLEYLETGTIPTNALKFGAEQVRKAELQALQERQVAKLLAESAFKEAAE